MHWIVSFYPSTFTLDLIRFDKCLSSFDEDRQQARQDRHVDWQTLTKIVIRQKLSLYLHLLNFCHSMMSYDVDRQKASTHGWVFYNNKTPVTTTLIFGLLLQVFFIHGLSRHSQTNVQHFLTKLCSKNSTLVPCYPPQEVPLLAFAANQSS